MTLLLPIGRDGVTTSSQRVWSRHVIALAGAWAAILLLFGRDAADIVRIWIDSSTYNHCLLILPILAWLVWQRASDLRQLQPCVWWPGLLVVAAGALAWLIGFAGGVALARHLGLVLALQGSTVLLLGKAVTRGLTFPIFYAFFLVPAGEEFVPIMQTVTADISMVLLGLTGIPAHIEGVFISTPAGLFEVAEACSGVKFLVAMLAYGALAANLCFRSWTRRLCFMAAAIAIPILANGVRAWGTIYIASKAGVQFADGFDHVFYGWIFFAVVIALLMGGGWFFFDRSAKDRTFDPAKIQPTVPEPTSHSPLTLATIAAALVLLVPVGWSAFAARAGVEPVTPGRPMPEVEGWQRVRIAPARHPWAPHFTGADSLRMARYQNGKGQAVDLAIAVFRFQEEGRELVGFGQGPVGPESNWAWTAEGLAPSGGRLDRIASYGVIREVATFYRVGNVLTGSPLAVKIETAKARLWGGRKRAVAVMVSAEAPAEGVSPRPAIDAFLHALGPVEQIADSAGSGS